MTQKITNIIFDFDGTIADTSEFVYEEIHKQTQKFKLKITKKEIKHTIQEHSFISLIKQFKINQFLLIWIIWRIQRHLGKQIRNFKTFPHIKQIINQLNKTHNLYILTGNSKNNVEDFLKNNNLENKFQKIKSRVNPFDKSNSINKFMKKYELKKSETIYIGDELSDLKACKKLKLKIISVSYGLNSKNQINQSNPKYLIESPKEIISVINQIEKYL